MDTMKIRWNYIQQLMIDYYYRSLSIIRYWSRASIIKRHSLPKRLIISLTSYPPRFHTLHLTLKTLLSQNVRPDLVVLALYKNDYFLLPKNVLSMQGDNFKIITTEKDIKSYTKLIPVKSCYPSDFIVTADDDTYYNRTWLREMVDNYDSNKKEALGHRAHLITTNEMGGIKNYKEWDWEITDKYASEKILLTGIGGNFYPPASLSPEVLNENEFMELCSTSDDIWFYFMLRKNGFVCRKIGNKFIAHSWWGTQKNALNYTNVHEDYNDKAIMNLMKKYGNPLVDFGT